MATRFKYMRAVRNKSYAQQGAIYFTCVNYRTQPERVQRRIETICRKAAGEYWEALLEYLTTDADWIWVCDHYHISRSTLDRVKIKFYALW